MSHDLKEIKGFASLPRVTSDCRPFKAGGKLFVCLSCGGVQKIPDAVWLEEIEGIYSQYEAYYQSGGTEQIIFDRITGQPRRRSEVILDRLCSGNYLERKGYALDVGCGNGATLRAMSDKLSEWSFSGHERGGGNLKRLIGIPRFKNLYTGPLAGIPGRFKLVTLIHSLEHFPLPGDALTQLRTVVATGKIFVEVPNAVENPFDILIADHLIHFTPETLLSLLKRRGFEVAVVATDWIPKEISLLAVRDEKVSSSAPPIHSHENRHILDRVNAHVQWLSDLVRQMHDLREAGRLTGIFGTSIAATWLAGILPDHIDFFVDEDSNRIGKEYLGKPIFHPSQVPENAKVFFATSPEWAASLIRRFSAAPFEKVSPLPVKSVGIGHAL